MKITTIEKIKDCAIFSGFFALLVVVGTFIAAIGWSGYDDIIINTSFAQHSNESMINHTINIDFIVPLIAGLIVFLVLFGIFLWAYDEKRMGGQ